MRNEPNLRANRMRVREGPLASDDTFGNNGAFCLSRKDGPDLWCVVSAEGAWDHVSVSVMGAERCPTWAEMDLVKNLFFRDEEAVMQLHPPRSTWINNHPHVLHLWRPHEGAIPLPPSDMVGYDFANVEAKL